MFELRRVDVLRPKNTNLRLECIACPHCNKGEQFLPGQNRFVECDKCYGRGSVVSNHICACGVPVKQLSDDNKFVYCGEKTCLKALREDVKEESFIQGPTLRAGFPGYGFRSEE